MKHIIIVLLTLVTIGCAQTKTIKTEMSLMSDQDETPTTNIVAFNHERGKDRDRRDRDRVSVDPTFTWVNATTDCAGQPLSGALTTNIYCVPGAVTSFPVVDLGPLPSPTPTPGTIPELPVCTVRNVINPGGVGVIKLNPTPITGTSFHATMGNGVWTCAIEHLLAGAFQSPPSALLTFKVVGRWAPPGNPGAR